MSQDPAFAFAAGFDWARTCHVVGVVDPQGVHKACFQFEDTAEGWRRFERKMRAFPHVALAIETSRGAVIDRLLERGL